MRRVDTSPELSTVVQNTVALAPTGPQIAIGHRAGTDGTLDLLPFEKEMVDVVNAFIGDATIRQEQVDLMKKYQKIYTENVYAIGLTQYPGALIINKRFANIPAGAPIFMFNWAEDNIIRERVYVPADKQRPEYQLQPETLPGRAGLSRSGRQRDKTGQGGASLPCPPTRSRVPNAAFHPEAHPCRHPGAASS